jgi:hypothetical protein
MKITVFLDVGELQPLSCEEESAGNVFGVPDWRDGRLQLGYTELDEGPCEEFDQNRIFLRFRVRAEVAEVTHRLEFSLAANMSNCENALELFTYSFTRITIDMSDGGYGIWIWILRFVTAQVPMMNKCVWVGLAPSA